MKKKVLNIDIKSPQKGNPIDKYFFKYLNSLNNIIVFSPHLDDAILSMGSLIFHFSQMKVKVEIITIFTEGSSGSSKAIQRHLENANFFDSKKYFQARRSEDLKALSELGNDTTLHLGYVDAQWRRSKRGFSLYNDCRMIPINKEDYPLYDELVLKFKKLFHPTEKTGVFAPLARGRHIDHQIVRNVASLVFPQTIFYQDFPYSALYENEDYFIKINNLKDVEWKGDYEAKKKAILQYKTQRYSLFHKGPMILPYEKYYIQSISLL